MWDLKVLLDPLAQTETRVSQVVQDLMEIRVLLDQPELMAILVLLVAQVTQDSQVVREQTAIQDTMVAQDSQVAKAIRASQVAQDSQVVKVLDMIN